MRTVSGPVAGRPTRAVLSLAAALAAGTLAGAACGESQSKYVGNGSENAYFKVPRAYELFDLPTGRDDRLQPENPEEVELLWSVGFDADDDPAVENVQAARDYDVAVDSPVGIASIYQVQGSYNQQLSLTTLRTVPLGFDPLYVQDDAEDLVEIIDFAPLRGDTGLQGSRVLFNMRPTVDDPWRTYDMTTYFDQGRFRMYTFTVGCSAPCFKDREAEIRRVTSSWTVEP
jgi:hypothetical protein